MRTRELRRRDSITPRSLQHVFVVANPTVYALSNTTMMFRQKDRNVIMK
jgi:hypothetical protein